MYNHIERNIADQAVDEEAVRRQREEEELLQGGDNDYPAIITCSLDGLHSTNIISVLAWPGQPRVITGAGDGMLQCIDMEGIIQWRTKLTGGGILTLMMHPLARLVHSLCFPASSVAACCFSRQALAQCLGTNFLSSRVRSASLTSV